MGSFGVVVGPPFFDALPGIGHRDEPGSIQALRTKAAVERLDEPVISGFPRPREVEFDLVASTVQAHPKRTKLVFRTGLTADADILTTFPRNPEHANVGKPHQPLTILHPFMVFGLATDWTATGCSELKQVRAAA